MTQATITPSAARAAAAVDGDRLWRRLMAMAEIGAIPGNGVNRQALSAEDIRARARLIGWAEARGFAVAVDAIGNLFIRREGSEPEAAPVLTGSHMDSQPRGGRFDGIYGVLAGFEVLESLADAGVVTRRPVELVAWTNEEGSRFAPGAMGSMVFAGAGTLDDVLGILDGAGVTVAEALAATLAATPDIPRRPLGQPIAAYLEAHIEQGPVLERQGVPIGAVTGIQGSRWFTVEVLGESAHAGTSPRRQRRDALRAAVAAINALEVLMADPEDVLRFTIGRLLVEPNAPNSVPGRVQFSIDLRHPDAGELTRRGDAVAATVAGVVAPCTARVIESFSAPPIAFAAAMPALVERCAAGLALNAMRLPSGAFHDANFLNRVAPTGMIFIPCLKGISHNEAEFASPGDCAAGARVLAAALTELAAG